MSLPEQPMAAARPPSPSLAGRLLAGRGATALRIGMAILSVILAVVAMGAGLLAHRARSQAVAMGDAVARAGAVAAADREAASRFAAPALVEDLRALADHLPPGTRLASAGRDADGRPGFAIDSADPDSLRALLRADPWFSGFRERGQAVGEDGAIRVRFERMP